jgi:glycine cleavage system protein P-like pyridoxal-binding family
MVLWAEEMGVDMIDFSPVSPRWNWTEKEKNLIKITTTSEYRKLDKIVDTLIKMKRENNNIETSEKNYYLCLHCLKETLLLLVWHHVE